MVFSSKDDNEKEKGGKNQDKDSAEPERDKKQDEEEKIEMPEKQFIQTTIDSNKIKKSILSTKSTRVFVPEN